MIELTIENDIAEVVLNAPEKLNALDAAGLAELGEAELISGTEAVASGLFSRALPDEEVLDFTRATVAKVAQGATEAFLASPALVASIRDDRVGLWESMAEENRAQAALAATADYAEGFRAFQARRPPVFRGRP